MSSRSAAEPLAPPARIADAHAARLLAVAALCGFAIFAQLDAVSNRLSGSAPITLITVLVAAVPASTLLVLLAPNAEPLRARGTTGARLMLMLAC